MYICMYVCTSELPKGFSVTTRLGAIPFGLLRGRGAHIITSQVERVLSLMIEARHTTYVSWNILCISIKYKRSCGHVVTLSPLAFYDSKKSPKKPKTT